VIDAADPWLSARRYAAWADGGERERCLAVDMTAYSPDANDASLGDRLAKQHRV
jgi:hypothetical protein